MLAEVDYIWALLQKDNILNVQLLTLKTGNYLINSILSFNN
jgi:hypothetical protein